MKTISQLSISERRELLHMGRRGLSVKDPVAYWNKAIKKNPLCVYAREYMTILYGDVTPACIAAEECQADEIMSARHNAKTIEQMSDESFATFKAHIAQLAAQ